MTGILIGTHKVKVCFLVKELGLALSLTNCEHFFQKSEWQRQQNSGVMASHGEAAAATVTSVCVCVGECRVKII